MLAEVFLGRSIGDQTRGIVPAQFADRIYRATLGITIALRTNRVSERRFQLRAVTKRFNVLKRDGRRSAVCIFGRHAEGEVFSPIEEGPPTQVSHESVRSLLVEKPVQHGPCAGYLRFDESLVVSAYRQKSCTIPIHNRENVGMIWVTDDG